MHASQWIQPNVSAVQTGARLRLFCFPYAGGGASAFRHWSRSFPADLEICPVQLPGRENRWREQPFTRLSLLIEALAAALHPLMNMPFAFFGHSMGALISFELARQLRRETGEQPVHILVSGTRAPQLPDPEPSIHRLPNAAFVAALQQSANGIPQEVLDHAEFLSVVLPTLRADVSLCERYLYYHEPPLACPISAYGGMQDRRVSARDLTAWRELTCGPFEWRMFDGAHFFPWTDDDCLAEQIGDEIARALQLRPV